MNNNNNNNNNICENANILVVDDLPENLMLLSEMLKKRGYKVSPAPNGRLAIQSAKKNHPDLILLDVTMPDMSGYEVCKILKEDKDLAEIPIIFISALTDTREKVEAFSSGGVDYVTKPFQLDEVYARVSTHLKLHTLQSEMKKYNEKLEKVVEAQVREIFEAQMAMIFAVAKLAESRDDETGKHLERVQRACRAITLKLCEDPVYGSFVTRSYAENIFHASPLHDIGKVAIQDNILLKPGKLTPEEFEIMKTHTVLGAKTLTEVQQKYPNNQFIKMGIAIAQYHHERWDGKGYPLGIAGENIPLSARIMSVADVYDALRSKRCYKEPLPHKKTYDIIVEGYGTQFDPSVISAFIGVHEKINDIYESLRDI